MKIKGTTVSTPAPRTNFNQTDPRKADYLVGRENIPTKALTVEGSFNGNTLTSTEKKSISFVGDLPYFSITEIHNAIADGREVRIELVDTEYTQGNYLGTSLPKMKRIEARVVELTEVGNDTYTVVAEGFGSTDNQDTFYRVKITVDSPWDVFSASAYLFTEPLIVTGNPKCNALMMGGTNYAMYQIQTLSHTAKEICDAFGQGRDVYIRLENAMAIGNLVSGSPLPDIKNIEARVVSAQKDMMYPNGYAVAYGTGYTLQAGQLYMVNISFSNDTINVTAYLYKAYEDNTAAINSLVDKRIANNNTTIYAEVDRRISNALGVIENGTY